MDLVGGGTAGCIVCREHYVWLMHKKKFSLLKLEDDGKYADWGRWKEGRKWTEGRKETDGGNKNLPSE